MSVLEPDEVVTAIKVPVTGKDKTAYLKSSAAIIGFCCGRRRRARGAGRVGSVQPNRRGNHGRNR